MTHLLRIFLLALATTAPAYAVVLALAPSNFVLDGSVEEWAGYPAAATTGRPDGNEGNTLWIAQTSGGFVAAGRLGDSRFPFAAASSPNQPGGRLEIWLSLAEDFDFPAMLFTQEQCDAAEGPAKTTCLVWIKQQSDFRDNTKKLFTRMWRIVPSAAEEAYALPIYNSLSAAQRDDLGFPKPDSLPERKFRTGPDGEVTFEILIPWNLFPPANRLQLEHLRFRVDFDFGSFVNVSTGRVNRYALDDLPSAELVPPRAVSVGRCAQPLTAFDTKGDETPAYYSLNADGRTAQRVFTFENYMEPYPPLVPPADYHGLHTRDVPQFAQQLSPDELLCGPYMSYRKGALVKQFPIWIGPDPGSSWTSPMPPFFIKTLPDGTRLLRFGPIRSFYNLSHQAAEIWTLKIFSFSPSLNMREALKVQQWMYGIAGFEIKISDDWRHVTAFQEKTAWESEAFCLAGLIYKPCGKNTSAPAPKRVLTKDQ